MTSSSSPVTETVIFQVKEGVRLDNINRGAGDDPAKKTFTEGLNTIRNAKGFTNGQYWGHQVENPSLFVVVGDWESEAAHSAFATTPEYAPFVDQLKELFDFEALPPFAIWTKWSSDSTAAMSAPVTEVAYFTLSHPSDQQDAIKEVEKALAPTMENVQKVGKAHGGALGWATRPEGIWLGGVFGYGSIEAHMKWRQQPEHELAAEATRDLEKRGLELQVAEVPGIDMRTGYFHVEFEAGQ